jgi:hypothetical protein
MRYLPDLCLDRFGYSCNSEIGCTFRYEGFKITQGCGKAERGKKGSGRVPTWAMVLTTIWTPTATYPAPSAISK